MSAIAIRSGLGPAVRANAAWHFIECQRTTAKIVCTNSK